MLTTNATEKRHNNKNNNKFVKWILFVACVASILANQILSSKFDMPPKDENDSFRVTSFHHRQRQEKEMSTSFLSFNNDGDESNSNNDTYVEMPQQQQRFIVDKKTVNNNNDNGNQNQTSSSSQTIPQRILFVHVGKSGGQSLKYALEVGCHTMSAKYKRQECLDALPDSKISRQVKGYMHVQRLTINTSEMDGLLLVLRHPLHRFVSWYNFVNPNRCRNRHITPAQCKTAMEIQASQPKIKLRKPIPDTRSDFFYECFPSVTNITTSLQPNKRMAKKDDKGKQRRRSIGKQDCLHLLKRVLEGTIYDPNNFSETFAHMIYNLQLYIQIIQPKVSQPAQLPSSSSLSSLPFVYVVRTENLWSDMKDIDILLGGNGNFGNFTTQNLQVTHYNYTYTKNHNNNNIANKTSPKLVSTTELPPINVARQRICCLLHKEMVLYRDLLLRAENLVLDEAYRTWKLALIDCGFTSSEENIDESSWDNFYERRCLNDTLLQSFVK